LAAAARTESVNAARVIGAQVYKEKRLQSQAGCGQEHALSSQQGCTPCPYRASSLTNQIKRSTRPPGCQRRDVGYRLVYMHPHGSTDGLTGLVTLRAPPQVRLRRPQGTTRVSLRQSNIGQAVEPDWRWQPRARERRTSDAVGQSYREDRVFVGVSWFYRR